MDIVSWLLSRKYTDMSIVGLGAIKGANCTVKDIVHQDGINTVTFEWTGTDGTIKTRDMVVYDGTPIYVWESGNTYHYGDLAIYESQFYRCIIENSDVTFDNTKWNEIGSPDGNYDIVQSKELLPARFTAADRKLYFVIDECIFYLWDGTQWVAQTHLVQESTMPTASAKYLGRMYQYIGATNANFTHGYVYDCVSDGQTVPTFTWENVEVQPCIASHTTYDNTNSGLTATNVQDAIDEINTIKQDEMQVTTMPLASVDNLGKVYQYIGVTTVDYEHGCFYECVSDGAVTPTYSWKNIGLTPTFTGTQAQWDLLTSAQQNQYDIVNITGDQQDLNLGQYLRKVSIMPNAEDAPSETVLYVGATTPNYTQGFTYRSVPVVESGVTTYHWESVFGTAAQKGYTDNVRPNSHDLVESNAVYNAISSSIASIYKPHGSLTCAQLTSDLLIAANIGNVYNMTDSGTTSALFIQGAGKTIHVNDTVGIIQADNSEIMFNLMGSMLDLHDYQTKELETPISINGVQKTTVESTLQGLNSYVTNSKADLTFGRLSSLQLYMNNHVVPNECIIYIGDRYSYYTITSRADTDVDNVNCIIVSDAQKLVPTPIDGYINIRVFGGVAGNQTSANNTLLVNAINYTSEYGYILYLGKGTFYISSTITTRWLRVVGCVPTNNYISATGSYSDSRIVFIPATSNCDFINDTGMTYSKISFKNVDITCPYTTCTNQGWVESQETPHEYLTWTYQYDNVNCFNVANTPNSNLILENVGIHGFSGFAINNNRMLSFNGLTISNGKYGFYNCHTDLTITDVNLVKLENALYWNNGGANLFLYNAWIDMCGYGIYSTNALNGTISQCTFTHLQYAALASLYSGGLIMSATRLSRCGMYYLGTDMLNEVPSTYSDAAFWEMSKGVTIAIKEGRGVQIDVFCKPLPLADNVSVAEHMLPTLFIFGDYWNNSIIKTGYDFGEYTAYFIDSTSTVSIDNVNRNPLNQRKTMPLASEYELGHIYQYIGASTINYTHGGIYECISDGQDPAIYSWQLISSADMVEFTQQDLQAMW